MPRASKNRLHPNKIQELEERFFSILSSHGSKTGAQTFLKDLLTEEEQIMLFKRIGIYTMLELGSSTEDIIFVLKVSRETVRIHKYRYERMGEVLKSSVRKFIGIKMRNEFIKTVGKSVVSVFSVSDSMKKNMSLDKPPYER